MTAPMKSSLNSTPRALILSGDGINCENETKFACEKAGFTADIRHLNDLISEKMSQTELSEKYRLIVLPGGFSFGDELGSGRVLALKIQHGLGWDFEKFTDQGGLVLGICNGFQALIRLGVFGSDLSITHNTSGKFLNTWVSLEITETARRTPWFKEWPKNSKSFLLPIRHGEGRILVENPKSLLEKIALTYTQDVNGSESKSAALVSKNGRILGLMPHPEAFIRGTQSPAWTRSRDELANAPGQGLLLFQNAYREVQK